MKLRYPTLLQRLVVRSVPKILLAFWFLPAPALFAQETGMTGNPVFRQVLDGDFTVVGTNTRAFGMTIPQSNPFSLSLNTVPAGASIVAAYLNWSYLTDNPNNPALASLTMNGVNVTGTLVGTGSPDLGWGQNSGASFLANVTSIVLGNGTFGITNATDKAGAYGEGLSLLVVYQKAGLPTREVDVYSGYTSTASGNAQATFNFGVNYTGGPVHYFLNAIDGQKGYSDDFFIGTNRVSGLFGGSVGDAWQGKLGPNPDSNLYDHAETNDISAYMQIGNTSLISQTKGAGNDPNSNDFIGHTFGAISLAPEPSPALLVLVGLGGLIWVQTRRHRLHCSDGNAGRNVMPQSTMARGGDGLVPACNANGFQWGRAVPAPHPSPLTEGAGHNQVLLGLTAFMLGAYASMAAPTWSNVGPGNLDVPYQQYYGIRALSGRVSAIAWSRSSNNVVYLAGGGGGVWKSIDSGATWTVTGSDTDPAWTSVQVNALAVDPTDSDIVYAGTGDYHSAFRMYPIGLLQSVDGGSSWSNLGAFNNKAITKVVIDPDDSSILLVTTVGATLQPSGAQNSYPPPSRQDYSGQVWRSTDGGSSWNIAFAQQAAWTDAAIGGRDKSSNRWYYAIGYDNTGNPQLWMSNDRGVNWKSVTPPTFTAANTPAKVSAGGLCLTASQVNPQTVYAMSTLDQDVRRSTDAGTNWASIMNGTFPSGNVSVGATYNWSQGSYDYHIEAAWIPGTSVDVVYAGLITLAGTSDNGANWTDIGRTYQVAARTHSDQQSLAFNPKNPNQVLIGNDGGIFRVTFDPSTKNWGNITSGSASLRLSQFNAGAYDPSTANNILGGTQDNASPRSFGAPSPQDNAAASLATWNNCGGGDGGNCAIDPININFQFTEDCGSGQLYGTTNSWLGLADYNTNPVVLFNPPGEPRAWVPAFALDPASANGTTNVFYYGTDFLYRFLWDGTANAPTIANHLGATRLTTGTARATTTAIAIAPGDNNRVYVGSSDSALWMSTNALAPDTVGNPVFWQRVDTGSPGFPIRFVTSVAVDPFNQNRVFVGLSGKNISGHIWRCDNVMASDATRVWINMDSGLLPDISLNSVALDPNDPTNTCYVGTDSGVLYTTNAGASWIDASQPLGLPYVQVNDLKAIGGTGFLNAATYGRGIWRLPINTAQIAGFGITPNPLPSAAFNSAVGRVTLWQPAGAGGVNVTLSSDHPLVFHTTTLNIPQGQITATFTALALFVSPQDVTFTATVGAETRATVLHIVGPAASVVPASPPAPAIQSIVPGRAGSLTLTWSAVSGSTYRVQYKPALNSDAWTDLAPDIVAGGDTASFTDNAGNAQQRFYRIMVITP